MIARSVLLLIPFTMYLVCRTEGCGREDWRSLLMLWLDEEWTDLTDKTKNMDSLHEFIKLLYTKPQYLRLQDAMLQLRLTMEKELLQMHLRIQGANLRIKDEKLKVFKGVFTMMHRDFFMFFQRLPEKLKRRAPTELKNLFVLLAILPPDDHSFETQDTKLVLKKWQKMFDALKLVLFHIESYVAKKHLKWLQDQKKSLNVMIGIVDNHSRWLRDDPTLYGTDTDSSAGIGSANSESADLKKKIKSSSKKDLLSSLSL
ncbi:hypothetical protein Bpfe_012208 [Biomphalaria pfeifferi]|uniref:Uncharacterized protein n=1 Tax=Biomphalaria pfeifferi TaxID=112525 RepID=A0AAD8BQK9_BIOPF|nr:hypothetical protein Bpfe_012208 [Biomphalaria pfeifferi]